MFMYDDRDGESHLSSMEYFVQNKETIARKISSAKWKSDE